MNFLWEFRVVDNYVFLKNFKDFLYETNNKMFNLQRNSINTLSINCWTIIALTSSIHLLYE